MTPQPLALSSCLATSSCTFIKTTSPEPTYIASPHLSSVTLRKGTKAQRTGSRHRCRWWCSWRPATAVQRRGGTSPEGGDAGGDARVSGVRCTPPRKGDILGGESSEEGCQERHPGSGASSERVCMVWACVGAPRPAHVCMVWACVGAPRPAHVCMIWACMGAPRPAHGRTWAHRGLHMYVWCGHVWAHRGLHMYVSYGHVWAHRGLHMYVWYGHVWAHRGLHVCMVSGVEASWDTGPTRGQPLARAAQGTWTMGGAVGWGGSRAGRYGGGG